MRRRGDRRSGRSHLATSSHAIPPPAPFAAARTNQGARRVCRERGGVGYAAAEEEDKGGSRWMGALCDVDWQEALAAAAATAAAAVTPVQG